MKFSDVPNGRDFTIGDSNIVWRKMEPFSDYLGESEPIGMREEAGPPIYAGTVLNSIALNAGGTMRASIEPDAIVDVVEVDITIRQPATAAPTSSAPAPV